MKERQTSFLPLLTTNFLGVANDNLLKTLASFALIGWVSDDSTRTTLMGLTAAALVLPYVLLSPLADRLTCLFRKCRIVRLAKFAEIPIVTLAITGFWLQSIPVVISAIVLMGVQSALYSPSKYALVRDIGGLGRVSSGMGLMEGVSFLGVLGGTVAASFLADLPDARIGQSALLALALGGLLCSFTLRADEERSREFHAINPLRFFRRARRMTARYEGLGEVILALCAFWGTAAMIQQGMLVYGTQVLRLDATRTGALLVLAAVGIVCGQVLAGYIDQKKPLLAFVPAFGALAAALLAVLFFAPLPPRAFSVVLGLLSFVLGFFKLPLDAAIQRQVKGPRLTTILAYFNQITFLWMFGASVAYAALGWAFGPRAFLAFLALTMLAAALRFCFGHRTALFGLGTVLLGPRYRVRADALPGSGPRLVLPNHPALVDPLLVLTTYRAAALRPLVDKAYFSLSFFRLVLGALKAIPVPDLRKRHTAADVEAVRGLCDDVLDALRAGTSVVFYPSGHIYTENAERIGSRQLAHAVCRDLPPGVTVVGLRTEGLWGSMWSRKGRKTVPPFALTLARGALLWPLSFVRPRRGVSIAAEDLTERVRAWSAEPRRDFNGHLEDWYNLGTDAADSANR